MGVGVAVGVAVGEGVGVGLGLAVGVGVGWAAKVVSKNESTSSLTCDQYWKPCP